MGEWVILPQISMWLDHAQNVGGIAIPLPTVGVEIQDKEPRDNELQLMRFKVFQEVSEQQSFHIVNHLS